jgi:hypothetical protein
MEQVIIYNQDNGNVAMIIPTPVALQTWTIQQIADKDVPHGKPYKIVNRSDLPEDNTFFNAWEISDEELTDGVGAESNEFPEVITTGESE